MNQGNAVPYVPQYDSFNAVEAFARRVYNPKGDPEKDRSMVLQPYVYPVIFDDLASAATATQVVNIAANADFILFDPRYHAVVDTTVLSTVQGGQDVVPLVNIQVTDTGSQETFFAQAADLSQVFTNINRVAAPWFYPRIITGRSGVSVQVTNYANVLTTPFAIKKLSIALGGVLVKWL